VVQRETSEVVILITKKPMYTDHKFIYVYSESGRMPPSSGGGVCQDNRIGRRTIQVGIGFRTFDKKEKRTDRKEKRTDRKEKRA